MSKAQRFEVPNPPADAVLIVSASVKIACSASHAYRVLTNTSDWPKWNTFVPEVYVSPPGDFDSTADPAVLILGSQMIMHVRMKPGASATKSPERVTEVVINDNGSSKSSSYHICWIPTAFPSFLLRAKRENVIRDVDDGTGAACCEYMTWEVMSGPGAYAVRTIFGSTLQARFEDWANDLKVYAEQTWLMQ